MMLCWRSWQSILSWSQARCLVGSDSNNKRGRKLHFMPKILRNDWLKLRPEVDTWKRKLEKRMLNGQERKRNKTEELERRLPSSTLDSLRTWSSFIHILPRFSFLRILRSECLKKRETTEMLGIRLESLTLKAGRLLRDLFLEWKGLIEYQMTQLVRSQNLPSRE